MSAVRLCPHRSGDLVYARVAAASRDLEPQLSCVDALGRATVMGPLKVWREVERFLTTFSL